MVALEPVVQILGLSMLELRRDRAVPLQLGDRLAIGRVLVGVDDPRDPFPTALQGCAEEALGRLCVAPVGEVEIEGRTVLVDRTVGLRGVSSGHAIDRAG